MPELLQRLRNRPWLLPILVFAVLVSITLHVWRWQKDILTTAEIEELNRTSAGYTTDINDRLSLHAQFLRSIAAYVSAHPEHEYDTVAWHRFTGEVEAFTHLPGIYAFAYASAVPLDQRAQLSADIRHKLKIDDFKIFPAGRHATAFPVTLVSPDNAIQRSAIGFDIASEHKRRTALYNAIDTRQVTLSGRLTLVNDQLKRPAFALFKAIYRAGMPLNNVEERRAAVVGMAISTYRVNEFIETISRNLNNRFVLHIFDDNSAEQDNPAQQNELIYNSDPLWAPAIGAIPLHHEIQFGDRNWIIHFYPRTTAMSTALTTPNLILFGGLTLSLLISILLFHQSTHRSRAEIYAHRLTADLIKSEERFRLAVAGGNDGLWDQDMVTGEEYMSPRLGEIYGFSTADMPHFVNDYVRRVLPEDEPKRRACLRRHLHGDGPYDVEVRIRKRDGELAWIRIRGEAVFAANRRAVRLAGSVTDVTALHLAEEELRGHRDHLQVLVDEKTTRLEKALIEATRANDSKSEFLANMSHELRTPMHAINSFARLGQNRCEQFADEKLRLYFDRIILSANRLLTLINDLLDLSKLEAGKQNSEFVEVDLLSITENTILHLEPLIQSSNLTLDIDLGDSQSQMIFADQKLIEQIIHNLLANAIKFSPPQGKISISLASGHLPQGRRASDQGHIDALTMAIRDEGPGIPVNELEAIFDKFYQSSLTKTGAGGTGLGLAICREAVRQHHGLIFAENNPDKGATFTITLPRKPGTGAIR